MNPTSGAALDRYWPAALLAVALFPTLFINPTIYAEIAMTVVAAGLLVFTAVRYALRRPIAHPQPLTLSIVALVGYLALRSLFAPEPMVAFGGAYSSDGTVFSFAVMTVALLGLWEWRAPRAASGEWHAPESWALIVIASLGTASAIAAWQWGSTDPSGGPPSGFTANSQLQLQLLTASLTAAAVWLASRKREWWHMASAGLLMVALFVGMLHTRSAVMLPALAIGLAYAAVVHLAAPRVKAPVFAGAITVVVAAVGVAFIYAFANPSIATRLIPLVDRIGSGRGALWASSVTGILDAPLFGRGLGHSSAITSWTLDGPAFQHVSTVDPHSLFLVLAAGGGLLAIALGLWVIYRLQVQLVTRVRTATPEWRLAALAAAAGGVMLFVLSQFTFVFTFGWMLMALVLAIVLPSPEDQPREPRGMPARVGIVLVLVGAVLASSVWFTVPGRAGSTRAMLMNLNSTPAESLRAQLVHIRRPWDLVPAELASLTVRSWSSLPPEQSVVLRQEYEQAMTLVVDATRWDARMAAARLVVWSADAEAGSPDFEKLDQLVRTGLAADPGSGLWAVTGFAFANRYGNAELAAEYAALVRENEDWWRQAQTSVQDSQTLMALAQAMGR